MRARFGLSCALTTPFDETAAIDAGRLAGHIRRVLGEGCTSVTLFGTTGEGASVSDRERAGTVASLTAAGIEGASLVGAIAATSVDGAAGQCSTFLDAGCRALLVTPPFYFKGVSDDMLFAWYAALFAELGARARDVILYNIPSVTQVALSVSLVGRLREAFPSVVAGVKDSSGDWAYTQELLAAHRDLAILIGDERHLAAGVRQGAEGAISGMANIMAPTLLGLAVDGRDDSRVNAVVDAVLRHPVTPAVKALVAARTGDAAWSRARPPLATLAAAGAADVTAALDRAFAAAAA